MHQDRPLRGFSCPREPFDETFMFSLITLHATELWRFFLSRHTDVLSESLVGLAEPSLRWLEDRATFDAVWDRSFGLCHPSAFGELEPTAVAAGVGLRLAGQGLHAAWQARMQTPQALRFESYLLPATRELRAESDGHFLAMDLDPVPGRQRLVFRLRDNRWEIETATGETPRRIPSVEVFGRSIPLLFADGSPAGGAPPSAEVAGPFSLETIAETVRSAAAVLAENAPEYVHWVRRVLRGIGPIRQRRHEIRSGSSIDWPGVIAVSFPSKPAALAEMLVHECSHQYYHQILALGRVDDGSDTHQYYSPVKQTGRPIRKILLAFHAFANVLLVSRQCLERNFDDGGYSERNQANLAPQLRQMEHALRHTRALTPSGRALFEPLCERVGLAT